MENEEYSLEDQISILYVDREDMKTTIYFLRSFLVMTMSLIVFFGGIPLLLSSLLGLSFGLLFSLSTLNDIEYTISKIEEILTEIENDEMEEF